jgi:hypothetical protein
MRIGYTPVEFKNQIQGRFTEFRVLTDAETGFAPLSTHAELGVLSKKRLAKSWHDIPGPPWSVQPWNSSQMAKQTLSQKRPMFQMKAARPFLVRID